MTTEATTTGATTNAEPVAASRAIWGAVGFVLIGLLLLALGGLSPEPPTGLLPNSPGELRDYPALESDGTELRTHDLLDKNAVVYFMFTSCPATCPPLTQQMLRLQEASKGRDDFRMVSFTVDPKNDTIEKLAEYADKVGADRERWKFLFTNEGVVLDIAYEGMKMGHPTAPQAHSNDFALVDRSGKLRAYYHPLKDPGWVDRLLADLDRLADEKVAH